MRTPSAATPRSAGPSPWLRGLPGVPRRDCRAAQRPRGPGAASGCGLGRPAAGRPRRLRRDRRWRARGRRCGNRRDRCGQGARHIGARQVSRRRGAGSGRGGHGRPHRPDRDAHSRPPPGEQLELAGRGGIRPDLEPIDMEHRQHVAVRRAGWQVGCERWVSCRRRRRNTGEGRRRNRGIERCSRPERASRGCFRRTSIVIGARPGDRRLTRRWAVQCPLPLPWRRPGERQGPFPTGASDAPFPRGRPRTSGQRRFRAASHPPRPPLAKATPPNNRLTRNPPSRYSLRSPTRTRAEPAMANVRPAKEASR